MINKLNEHVNPLGALYFFDIFVFTEMKNFYRGCIILLLLNYMNSFQADGNDRMEKATNLTSSFPIQIMHSKRIWLLLLIDTIWFPENILDRIFFSKYKNE